MIKDKNDNPDLRIWISSAHKECRICPETSKNKLGPSRGYGTFDSDIMFVGESSGTEYTEDLNYAWSWGNVSMYFKEMLKKYGFERDKCYFTNLIKCRLPNPTASHIKNCSRFIETELALVDPLLVVCMGNIAYNNLPLRGLRFKKVKMWHPSYVVRFDKQEEYESQWHRLLRTYLYLKDIHEVCFICKKNCNCVYNRWSGQMPPDIYCERFKEK